jgi:hypothetical protein
MTQLFELITQGKDMKGKDINGIIFVAYYDEKRNRIKGFSGITEEGETFSTGLTCEVDSIIQIPFYGGILVSLIKGNKISVRENNKLKQVCRFNLLYP